MKLNTEYTQKDASATESSTDPGCKRAKDCHIREWHGCGEYLEDRGYNAETGCTPYQQYGAMLVERAKQAIESVMRGEGISQEEMMKEAERRMEAMRQRKLMEQAAMRELSCS